MYDFYTLVLEDTDLSKSGTICIAVFDHTTTYLGQSAFIVVISTCIDIKILTTSLSRGMVMSIYSDIHYYFYIILLFLPFSTVRTLYTFIFKLNKYVVGKLLIISFQILKHL